MRKALRIFLAASLTLLAAVDSQAQEQFFSNSRPNATLATTGQRVIVPERFNAVQLDFASIKTFLWSLPDEKEISGQRNLGQILSLPMPDGSSARFRVWESSIQEIGLQGKFPNIRTFAGQGIDDPAATIRMDYSPHNGFHAQILSPSGRIYIDPYARGDVNNYISYYARDYRKTTNFSCGVQDDPNAVTGMAGRIEAACRGTNLYTYRLAVACTGEYAQAVGATTPEQLHAAIVTTVNRVTGVYESEVAIRMVLVANNNLIEYLDPATDQFNGNNNAGTLIGESQTVINSIIGAANYDIGHTFSTGGGGLAGLRVVCSNTQKARGITGSSQPFGDAYDIDYVAHEIGHQFGGNHTFNSSTSSCGGGNRNSSTAYEVGSGTTIQAYAGICGSDNIQPNSDPYFHPISFDEISNFVEAGGATCRQVTATGNTLPVITSMPTNGLNIPRNTPFVLTATATDADGDALTYSWEQFDLGPSTTWSGGANSATAPLFKSRVPKASGSRMFPDTAVILANYPANPSATLGGLKGETLPQVARAMKFRVTVRDNRAGGAGVVSGGSGCSTGGFTGDFVVNTVDGTGPFLVTAPNGGESYPGGSVQNITWNVAGTDAAPISCANVRISFSTDGFRTSTVLAASTPNDGSEALAIPVGLTNTARIRIEAIGNIFFDISNQDFSVTPALDGFDFSTPAPATVACNGPTTANITLGTTPFGTFNTPINLTATGAPAGTTVSFGTNPLTPGSSTTVTLNGVNTLSNGSYVITVNGVAGSQARSRELTFTVQAGAAPTISTQPVNAAVCIGTNANFSVVAAGATGYQWQVSTDGGNSFNNVATGGTGSSYTVNNVTAAINNHRYRVNVIGQCGVAVSDAVTLTAQQAPAISANPANATLCEGSNATFNVTASGTALSYVWQVSTDGGNNYTDIGSSNNASYTVNGITPAQNSNRYRVQISGTCAPAATSTAALLTVVSPVQVTVDPQSIAECETGNVTFSVSGAGSGIIYAWQRSADGGNNWQTVTNGGVYSGATTSTISLTNLPPDYNNYRYRALLSNSTCTTPDVSAAATLTVNARPTVTLAATRQTLQPGQTSVITASILPSPAGFNISWFRNDQPLAGNAGNTSYTADVNGLGNYKVTILNPTTGCNNESQVLTIGAEASSRLFIYPSPNAGQFTVSYYNSAWNNQRQTIAVYDSKGALVYNSIMNLTGPYTLHPINLAGKASGVYYVILGDASGKKITEGKVLISY